MVRSTATSRSAKTSAARRLIVNAFDPPNAPLQIGYQRALEHLVETWTEFTRRAHAVGVTLSSKFEPCWAFNEPQQIIEIAHRLAGPGFGVLFDTAHAHAVSVVGARQRDGGHPLPGGQVEFLQATLGKPITSRSPARFQQAACTRSQEHHACYVPFGQGEVDFGRVIAALIEAGGATEVVVRGPLLLAKHMGHQRRVTYAS